MTEIYVNPSNLRVIDTNELKTHGIGELNDRDVVIIKNGKSVYEVPQNDKSVLKGAFWAIIGVNLFSAGVSTGSTTIAMSPFLLTPLAPIPAILGLVTYALMSGSCSCAENTLYHFSPNTNVVVLKA